MSSCWHAMDTPQREPALGYFIHGFSVNGEGRMLMKTWRGVFMPSSSKNNYMQFLQSTSPAVNISGKSEKLHISQLIARREICRHTYTCLKSVLRIRFITFIYFFCLTEQMFCSQSSEILFTSPLLQRFVPLLYVCAQPRAVALYKQNNVTSMAIFAGFFMLTKLTKCSL